jgi:ABC-type branched-subunit amino acid transport system permease subunit
MIKNLSVEVAARYMGVNPQFVRVGLQQGILQFGYAVKVGGGKYTYYISPVKFCEFTGASMEDIEESESRMNGGLKRWTIPGA